MDKVIIVVCVLLIALLLFPVRHQYKDGGSVHYDAIAYDVYDMHRISDEGEIQGYTVGNIVEIFGFEVFNNTRFEAIDTNSPYFCGRVIEINSKGFLVEVTDGGNGSFALGERVQVNTELGGEYKTGDNLRIAFDGKVAMSYPPQVTSVQSIVRQ
jgi:hypothetical protein